MSDHHDTDRTYWLDDKIAAIRKAYKAEATDEELQ